MRLFFLLSCLIVLANCTVITKRENPAIDSVVLQNQIPKIKSNLIVRIYSDSITNFHERYNDFNSDLKYELEKTFQDTKWFSSIKFIYMDKPSAMDFSRKPEVPLTNLDDFFKVESEPQSDYNLSIYFRSSGVEQWFLQSVLGLFTLGIIPLREDYRYTVGFRLRVGRQIQSHDIILSEKYTQLVSTIPYPGTKLTKDKEVEPVVNLVKMALLDYRKQELMK